MDFYASVVAPNTDNVSANGNKTDKSLQVCKIVEKKIFRVGKQPGEEREELGGV